VSPRTIRDIGRAAVTGKALGSKLVGPRSSAAEQPPSNNVAAKAAHNLFFMILTFLTIEIRSCFT
jgi:hypothetical protein